MSNIDASTSESRGTAKAERSKLVSRKVRAILAGGLVLGVGVGVTLAAWNDSDFAKGTYTAGTFALEGSVVSGLSAFGEHPESTPATLAFSVPALNLSPNDVTYAPYALRLSSATTTRAAVTLLATTTGTVTNLTYSLIKTESFGCDVTAITNAVSGDYLVTDEPFTFAIPNTVTFNLEMGSPTAATPLAGAAQNLCLAVTAVGPDAQGVGGIDQGQTGTSTISFTATSIPPTS